MTAELFSASDYQKQVQNWWTQFHGNAIDARLLSRLGVVVLDANEPIAVVHLYPATTANLVWLGFTIRAPHISKYKAGKALKLLIEQAEDCVRRLGYAIVYTGYDAPALQKLCKLRGYYEGSLVKEQWKAV